MTQLLCARDYTCTRVSKNTWAITILAATETRLVGRMAVGHRISGRCPTGTLAALSGRSGHSFRSSGCFKRANV